MRVPITVPAEVEAKQGKAYEWLNRSGPVDLTLEPIYISWIRKEGETIAEGETVAEGEVQKRIIELTAPCEGILAEIVLGDGELCSPGEVIGYIE